MSKLGREAAQLCREKRPSQLGEFISWPDLGWGELGASGGAGDHLGRPWEPLELQCEIEQKTMPREDLLF